VAGQLPDALRGGPQAHHLGEVGLGGELRPVPQIERRIEEATRLGFASAAIPERQAEALGGAKGKRPAVKAIPVGTLRDAIDRCLPKG